ncbi:MAG TPA: ATP-binding protein [Gemmatimonadales bacterium]|nr:ATP-binding protein [Gemmatimonadales bacterium]
MPHKPSLRAELLFNLAFLAGAALLLGVGTIITIGALTPTLSPTAGSLLLLGIVVLDLTIFILFGRYLVTRLVLRPVSRLVQAADAVAAGDATARAPDAETRELATLADRLNRMTDSLLDAQGQLVRSEKLASVGRLAAGVAHEIGNPLGAVGTYLEVLERRGADPEIGTGMRRELERIDRIVRSLLDFARPREEALQPVDPRFVAQAAFHLLQAQGALKRVQASLDLGDDLPPISGHAHALEQALVNLLLNASDAAPAGGVVVLGARAWAYEPGHRLPPRRRDDPPQLLFARPFERRPTRPEIDAGQPGVLLFVADSGSGVPPEHEARIFDPFFTTKEPGRGTGLGLAIVARTVEDMGGVVWVDPAREGGAAFKLFFPAVGQ